MIAQAFSFVTAFLCVLRVSVVQLQYFA